MNNKAIIEFGFRKDMKNSADLGGCYPPRPSASVDSTLLDLQNSSYPTQPQSIIAKYTAWCACTAHTHHAVNESDLLLIFQFVLRVFLQRMS